MDPAITSLPDKYPIDTLMLPTDKKIRMASPAAIIGVLVAASEQTSRPSGPASSPAAGMTAACKGGAFEALPTVAISHIGSFAVEGSLSGACRSALQALPRLHYKVNLSEDALPFSPNADPSGAAARGHLGLQASGALATGRVVTRITITGVGSSRMRHDIAGYTEIEEVVKRVMRHSITTLREITISGGNYCGDGRVDGRNGIAHILRELVPLSPQPQHVAPRLARVHLAAGATAVAMAGTAVAAGLWPDLEVLTFSNCQANTRTFEDLAVGMSAGLAPRLRKLCWENHPYLSTDPVDDLILDALAWGRCSVIEHLSFMGKSVRPENRTKRLFDALRACPRLHTLRVDCSCEPHLQLRDLVRTLGGGHAPRLKTLFVRASSRQYRDRDVELRALRRAAAARHPPVNFYSEIRTVMWY